MSKPTPGAMRAAEIIDRKTQYAPFGMSLEQFAEIIDRETAAPELLEAAKLAVAKVERLAALDPTAYRAWVSSSGRDGTTMTNLRAAIAKARGEKT